MKPVEVVFCGNSLYLSMLAASLQQNERLRISTIEHEAVKAIPELNMLCPDVLILEEANTTSTEIDPALKDVFCLMLIIVYRQTDSIEVQCKDRRFTAAVDSLAQVIIDGDWRSD